MSLRRLSLGALRLSRLVSSVSRSARAGYRARAEAFAACRRGTLLPGAQAPVVIELDDAHHLVPHRRAKWSVWIG